MNVNIVLQVIDNKQYTMLSDGETKSNVNTSKIPIDKIRCCENNDMIDN